MTQYEFSVWLKLHRRKHLLARLPDPDDDDSTEFYGHWLASLTEMGATAQQLEQVSARLADNPPRTAREHWPAIRKILGDLKQAGRVIVEIAAGTIPEVIATACRACPECEGQGWAIRYGRWHSIPRAFKVSLFCRCSAGRWRKANDPELLRGDRVRLHDDLQDRPDLWDANLRHATWKDRRCGHDTGLPGAVENRDWWYLTLDECYELAAAGTATVATVRGIASELAGRTSRYKAPVSLGPPSSDRIAADPILQREYQRPEPGTEA
jgi:hypothetical protein